MYSYTRRIILKLRTLFQKVHSCYFVVYMYTMYVLVSHRQWLVVDIAVLIGRSMNMIVYGYGAINYGSIIADC